MLGRRLGQTRSGLLVAVLLLVGCSSAPARSGGADVGIVLMHGKWDRPPTAVTDLARVLGSNGYIVVTPEMPWSGQRLYDVDYPAALVEIEAAVQSLRARPVRRVIVAGPSFGANAAIAYAGSGRELDGVIAIAPGHVPDVSGFRNTVASSVERAKAMIAEGKAAGQADFTDLNQGRTRTIRTTAQIPIAEYDRLVAKFDPVKFDARAWVAAAKDAGMRYVVITSKHHDGFCLFDSKQTEFDALYSTAWDNLALKSKTPQVLLADLAADANKLLAR